MNKKGLLVVGAVLVFGLVVAATAYAQQFRLSSGLYEATTPGSVELIWISSSPRSGFNRGREVVFMDSRENVLFRGNGNETRTQLQVSFLSSDRMRTMQHFNIIDSTSFRYDGRVFTRFSN